MTNDEEIRRAHEAERVLDDPLLKEAFASIETGLIDALKRCAIKDRDTQHECVLMLQLLARLHGHFKTIMETGKMARIQKETLTEKALRVVRRA